MKQHPLTMAVHHRSLESAMDKFAAIENPSAIQVQAHAAELVAKALDGSEVLVLCASSEGDGWTPVVANNANGMSYVMAATSIGQALDIDRWAAGSGLDAPADSFCYIPLSSRELLITQLAQGGDGILFNRTVLQPDASGVIEFGSVSLAIITQFAQLAGEGTVMPEELLTLLALEEDTSECQQIARDFFLNPSTDFSGASVFELQSVVVDGDNHLMVDRGADGRTAHMFSTNATAVMWGFRFAMERVPRTPRNLSIGFSIIMHNLQELVTAISTGERGDLDFVLDEKIRVDLSFAIEISKAHTDH